MSSPVNLTCKVINSTHVFSSKQGLNNFEGISAETTGAQHICMHMLTIPPGGRAKAHLHADHETAIYVLQGRVETLYGPDLAQSVVSEAGDFLFIPPDVPHIAINLSQSEPARAIVSRNDPAEQDKVRPYPIPG